jgi:hypothetical protein
MTPLDWLTIGIGLVTLLGAWLTAAWLHIRSTNRLIRSSANDTQAILVRMDERWRTIIVHLEQQANQRQQELLQVLQALKR